MTLVVVLLLSLLVAGTLPLHRYSRGWGYYPSAVIAVILVIVLLSIA